MKRRTLSYLLFQLLSPTHLKWNVLYLSLVKLHLRLKELGYIEHNGKVTVIDQAQEDRADHEEERFPRNSKLKV
ncbi:MAG TPA: hypothetical protein VGS08_00725 [Candidatus Saccharimonadales bacterium]|nr:hypothetical protein [Candidatus Saccharimonadales bacterium]